MKGSTHHQVHAVMTFLVAVVAGVLLIPLLRSQPEAVHKFVIELHDWQRIGFAFLLCVLYAYTMFRLFYPRIVHLLHLWTHPPAWFAWLLGLVVVGVVDVAIGLDPNGYRCTWQEWLGYAGGSIVLVAVCRRYFAPQAEEESPSESPGGLRLQNVENTDWSNLEEWLRSDAPADYDFLGNCAVAERLTTMLMDGTRSIGIVGPFGAGKTSIVKWMIDEIFGDAKFEWDQFRDILNNGCEISITKRFTEWQIKTINSGGTSQSRYVSLVGNTDEFPPFNENLFSSIICEKRLPYLFDKNDFSHEKVSLSNSDILLGHNLPKSKVTRYLSGKRWYSLSSGISPYLKLENINKYPCIVWPMRSETVSVKSSRSSQNEAKNEHKKTVSRNDGLLYLLNRDLKSLDGKRDVWRRVDQFNMKIPEEFLKRVNYFVITALLKEKEAILDSNFITGHFPVETSEGLDLNIVFLGKDYLNPCLVGFIDNIGRVPSAVFATKILHEWYIENVIVTGIAGGIANADKDVMNICEVVYADYTIDYASGKAEDSGENITPEVIQCKLAELMDRFLPEYQKYLIYMDRKSELAREAVEFANRFKARENNIKNKKIQKRNKELQSIGKIQKGTIVTTDKVIKSRFYRSDIVKGVASNTNKQFRKTIRAIEMEGASVHHAVENLGRYDCKFGCVRGISDNATHEKSKRFQEVAAYFAADFTLRFIDWDINEQRKKSET